MNRKSKQKETVLRIVKNTTSHPTADWVYEQARKEIPNISLGTVYRDLKLLQEEGQVVELAFNSHQSRFDGETRNHYHFRCEGCDAIFNVDEPVHTEVDRKVSRKSDFKVFYHRLEFRGLCNGCRFRNPVMGRGNGETERG